MTEERPNTGDRISEALNDAANVTDVLGQSGIKTGKMSKWLGIGSAIANVGGAIARLLKRK